MFDIEDVNVVCDKNNNKLNFKNLNILAKNINNESKSRGFWDKKMETPSYLMLIVSELSEAVEADRLDKFADVWNYEKTNKANQKNYR